jgi:hypothetical protein
MYPLRESSTCHCRCRFPNKLNKSHPTKLFFSKNLSKIACQAPKSHPSISTN